MLRSRKREEELCREPHRHRPPPDLDRLRILAPQRSSREHVENDRLRRDRGTGSSCITAARRSSRRPGSQGVPRQSRAVLKHPLLDFSVADFPIIADALAEAIREHNYTCYACAIMPDHVHILIRKHKHQAEDMLDNFQANQPLAASQCGIAYRPTIPSGAVPAGRSFSTPRLTSGGRFGILTEIRAKWRLPRQHWPFVKEYDGWPLHPGHSPNSPYAKAIAELQRIAACGFAMRSCETRKRIAKPQAA